jgi:gas vesicle structural protein
MAISTSTYPSSSMSRGGPSGLADVLDVLLDKGLVIDAFVRVSLVGIELLTLDARIVVAGVDTYLHFAEAVNRLDLYQVGQRETVPGLFRHEAEDKTRQKLGGGRRGREDGGRRDQEDGDRRDREDGDRAGRSEERRRADEGSDERSGDDDGSDGGIRGAIGNMISKARERGKWED